MSGFSSKFSSAGFSSGFESAFGGVGIARGDGTDDDDNIDPNAWTDEAGNAMTDEAGQSIIFTP